MKWIRESVISIVATANDQTNFTYWSGNQVITPNATWQFSNNNGWVMNDIYVYYEVSGQLFFHSLVPAPIP
jgi:hypothetical protein